MFRMMSNRSITVEPVLLLYIAALLLQLPIQQNFLYHRAQLHVAPSNQSDIGNDNHCHKNKTSLDNKIQHEASKYILGVGLAGTFPAIFTSLLFGPLSDRKGRKPIMMLPPLGSLLDVSVALATIYYQLPVFVMIIGAAIGGIFGSYTTLLFTVTAYIADTTSHPSKLSLRLARLEAIALIGGVLAQATSGIWVRRLGYAAPYWFMFSCHLISLLYIILSLPESNQDCSGYHNKSCYSIKDLKLLGGVIFKPRDDRGRLQLLFLFIALALFLLPMAVINQLVILYAKDNPLCWQADIIGYFLASLFLSAAVGIVLCVRFFKWFSWQDYSITQIGIVFLMGLLVMIGLSTNTLDMFLTCVLGFFAGLPRPCIKAQMSVIVEHSEQGSLFSITASIESLCNFLANVIFNPLYRLSLNFTWKHANGFVFFINSGIAILPFTIISFIKIYQNRRKGYEQINESIGTVETDK